MAERGRGAPPPEAAAEEDRIVHISSALVLTRPEWMQAVQSRIAALPGTEVAHAQDGRLVVVMEGPDGRSLGDRLAAIALYEGVLAANMVFEQAEREAWLREPVAPPEDAAAPGGAAGQDCRGVRP